MATLIRAGVLKRGHEDLSGNATIGAQTFDINKIENLRFGYLTPRTVNNLGEPSFVDDFTQTQLDSTSLVGADFYYVERDGRRVRYFVDAGSDDLIDAINSDDVIQEAVIASANEKTIVG